jgi:hypothetical protein
MSFEVLKWLIKISHLDYSRNPPNTRCGPEIFPVNYG